MPTALYDQPEIELLDGHAHPKVSPKTTHSLVQSALGRVLKDCGRGKGHAGPEWRFRPGEIDGTVTQFVPDVAFVAHERLKGLRGVDFDEPPFSPDIAVEVRSPSDNLPYLRQKISRYLATGSLLVLDVDPAQRCIIAHAADGVQTFSRGETFAHTAAPWLTFSVDSIFAELEAF